MISSTGTLKAMHLIERLEGEGHLVDVYSKKWMEENNYINFNHEDHQWLMQKYGPQFDSHLLLVYLVDQDYETFQDFVDVYPILKRALIDNVYQPTFLFINLETKQILCAGLGRRSSLFVFDAKTNKSLLMGEKFYEDYLRQFTALDYQNIVLDMLDALEQIGQSYVELDKLPGSLDEVEQILANADLAREVYSLKNDTLEYSLGELEKFESRYKEILDQQSQWIEVIQRYFPQFKSHHENMLSLLTD